MKLNFEYDWKGRRISKTVSNWNGAAYTFGSSTKFLYDQWNLLAELNSGNTLQRAYLWGADLSGSMQGAGGVGGLVAMKSSAAGVHFANDDGNGNVTALVDASAGTYSAQYEYGPFGEAVRVSGTQSRLNPFRFSTKFMDDESDLVYYGYRYCNANTGRWVNRDPIEEKGGVNIFAFLCNAPIAIIDANGRESWIPITDPRQGNPTGLALDCRNACTEAKLLGKDNGNAAGIICCGGKPYVCVWDPGGSTGATQKTAREIIAKCSTVHEQDHVQHTSCLACGLYRPRVYRFWKVKGMECTAYKAELKCLRESISSCRGDRKCETDVNAEIGDVLNRIAENCQSK
jgi:RHS repeat-associated protein